MKWIFLVGSLLLSGCATLDKVAVGGAKVYDKALEAAEWQICYAASVGSVQRRWGQSKERADLYREFCHGDGEGNIIAP